MIYMYDILNDKQEICIVIRGIFINTRTPPTGRHSDDV